MTQYGTDFAGYTTGAQPSDWTRRWVTTGGSFLVTANAGFGGTKNGLVFNPTADNRYGLSWNVLDSDADRDDAELLIRWKTTAGANADGRVFVRASGGAATETGYHGGSANGQSRISKLVAGTQTILVQPVNPIITTGVWYWTRMRANGSTLQVRTWADGASEPGTWNTTTTDTDITAAGWTGIYQGIQAGDTTWDFVGVGTNGDAAPSTAILGATVAAVAATATADAPAPAVTASVVVTGGGASTASALARVPVVTGGAIVAAVAAVATAQAVAPAAQAGSSGIVSAPVATATAMAHPAILPTAVTAVVATATAGAIAPTVSTGAAQSPPVVAATAMAPAPTIQAGVTVIMVSAAQATATAIPPTSVRGIDQFPTANGTSTLDLVHLPRSIITPQNLPTSTITPAPLRTAILDPVPSAIATITRSY